MLTEGIGRLQQSDAQICVVGSGPVGLSLAVECARKGIRTLLLEAGGEAAMPQIQQLSDAHLVEPARHDDMSIAVARRLGGTSHLWGGRCLPFDPIDFKPRDGVDARWPVSYKEMAAYLPRAVAATQSGAPVYVAEEHLRPDVDDAFSLDTLERWVNTQSSADVFKADIHNHPLLDVRTLTTVTGMVFADNGALTKLNVAHSLSGARAQVPVHHVVLAGGGVETARLLLAAGMSSNDRFGGEDGPLGRYYMGHLYGEIADIIFDDARVADAMDYHVDAHGSYVRRRFVASENTQLIHGLLNTAFWPLVPPVADPRHKSAILSLVYLALRDRRLGNRLVAEAIRRRHIPDDAGPVWPHIANILTGTPSAVAFSVNFLRHRYLSAHRMPGFFVPNKARRYGLSYHAEHAPHRDSRVRLNGQVDRLGVPRLSIDLRFAEQDARSVVATHDLMEDWLVRNRIGRLEYRVPKEARDETVLSTACHGTHQIGLARMADSRALGVVDHKLQTFDCPNLHLAGCAVLPTSGQANPTLTAVALGLRLADRLVDVAQREDAPVKIAVSQKTLSKGTIH